MTNLSRRTDNTPLSQPSICYYLGQTNDLRDKKGLEFVFFNKKFCKDIDFLPFLLDQADSDPVLSAI